VGKRLPLRQYGDQRTRRRKTITGEDDRKPPSLLALTKLQNNASVLHRSFAGKMLSVSVNLSYKWLRA
jgi:hypothetical protein